MLTNHARKSFAMKGDTTFHFIEEPHLAFAPVFLASGDALFEGIDIADLGYEVTEHVPTPAATHVVLTKQATR